MRLIDADKLKDAMYHEAFETDTPMQKLDGGCWVRYKLFENVLAEQPTAYTVKHGYWVDLFPNRELEFKHFECSECGVSRPKLYKYCPHCGALMFEEDE